MKKYCPNCGSDKSTHKQTRFLNGEYTEKNNISKIRMEHRECDYRFGCGDPYIFQIDYPLNPVLSPVKTAHHNWGFFNQAISKKQNISVGGDTRSEFTQMLCYASPVYLLKRYFDNPALAS